MNEQMKRLYHAAETIKGLKTSSEVARALNTSPQVLKNWETRGISNQGLLLAQKELGCYSLWLETGKGPMCPDRSGNDQSISLSQSPVEIPAGASIRVYEDPSELDPESYVWVDRYDVNLSAGCGNIQWVIQEKDPLSFRIKWFQFKKLKPENCKALYVRGRSMEPHLNDMDTVLIDTSQTTIVDGEIYALCYMDEFYIKTVLKIPGGYRLKSENPAFDSFDVLGENLNQLHIIGQKVWRAG